jgi:hypothetical protein
MDVGLLKQKIADKSKLSKSKDGFMLDSAAPMINSFVSNLMWALLGKRKQS